MPVWVDLGQIAGERVTARWFNPRTGMSRWMGNYAASSGVTGFDPPEDDGDPDYVLVLEEET
jgi:hypothetical protein